MHARSQLADDFRHLGVAPGDVIMLHASVRAVAADPHAADALVEGLRTT